MRLIETRPDRSLSVFWRVCVALVGLCIFQVCSTPTVYSSLDFTREQWCVHPSTIDSAESYWKNIDACITESSERVQRWYGDLTATPSYRIVSISQTNGRADLLSWPVYGSLSSGFGPRKHPVTRRYHFHAAVDIRAQVGTPVSAPCDGRIVAVHRAGAMGRMVKMVTPKGLVLSFGHLSGYRCYPGQSVRRGQILGLVGASGRATGPHLHFAVQRDGQYVNPLTFLASRTENQSRYLP